MGESETELAGSPSLSCILGPYSRAKVQPAYFFFGCGWKGRRAGGAGLTG